MPGPVLCASSILTSFALRIRNPQGGEQNWIQGRESIPNIYTHIAKIAVTEVAVSVLCVSAAIETLAYGVFIIGSLPIYPLTSRPLDYSCELFSSSLFTVVWNFGNVIIFNPFCINTLTDESFARYSLDHWTRGEIFHIALRVMFVALMTLSAFSGNHINNYPPIFSSSHSNYELYTRSSDTIYIAEWCRSHNLDTRLFGNNINPRLRDMIDRGRATLPTLDAGKNFMTKYLFADGQITPETRNQILEWDAEAYLFALSRLAYACVFVEPNARIDFFKAETQAEIRNLRNQYPTQDARNRAKASLDPFINNLTTYTSASNPVLNSIKGIGYIECRGGAMSQTCLRNAINDYNRAHPQ